MDPLDALDALARRARRETPPRFDTDAAALVRGCKRATVPIPLSPLAWSAAAAIAAATAVLTLAMQSGGAAASRVDSITPLFSPVQVELP